MIYYRVVNSELEDWEKADKFDTKSIIYDEWIIDIPKIINLIAIYDNDNSEILRKFFEQIFKNPKYEDDLKSCIQMIQEKFLSQIYQDIKTIKNRDNMDTVVTD